MSADTYRISDVVLASSIRLPELPPATAKPDWTFVLAGVSRTTRPARWFQYWRQGGRRIASFGRTAAGYIMRFHGLADFDVDGAERIICCRARRSAAPSTIRHLLLDQVIPLVLSRERRLVLHAAAVATPAGAVAFVGGSGSGKSTLAAALAVTGLPLLTDDCLVIERSGERLLARPFYPGARLWPDSLSRVKRTTRSTAVAHYTRKRRLAAPHVGYCGEPLPLGGVFVLKPPSSASDRMHVVAPRIRPRGAMLELLACTFQLDPADSNAARAAFELHSRIVETVPVRGLTYPWRLSRLGETCSAVKEILVGPM